MLANLHPYFTAGLGGILIGLASWMLWWGLGRIAGVSSITSEVIASPVQSDSWRWAFLAGLILGGCLLGQGLEIPTLPARPLYLLIPAGLLVGFGTVWGNGCTSGHGVCGLSRLSPRSLVATLTFMTLGFLMVYVIRHTI